MIKELESIMFVILEEGRLSRTLEVLFHLNI